MLLELTKKYCEPQRYYHTLEHIADMFQLAKRWDVELSEAQQLAIWFHDAIYDPTKNDNEEQSVILLNNLIATIHFKVIKEMILDTKKHKPSSKESEVVLDLDMAILGAPSLKYRRYSKQIRKEFSFVPNEVFNPIRGEFLHSSIKEAENNKLYFTPHAQVLNKNAIKNMKYELNLLQNGTL